MRKKTAAGAAAAAEKKTARKGKRPLTPGLSLGSGSGSPVSAGKLRVKQVRSGIGHADTYRRTLRALGLRHYQHEVVLADTPGARGMLRKVWHLVRVEPAGA